MLAGGLVGLLGNQDGIHSIVLGCPFHSHDEALLLVALEQLGEGIVLPFLGGVVLGFFAHQNQLE